MSCSRYPLIGLLTILCLSLLAQQHVHAQYTPYFVDGFDVSAATSNINFEIASRQSGPAAPLSYVTTTADPSDDLRHQMFDPNAPARVLQLAEDGTNAPGVDPINSFKSMVSPDLNFNGTLPNGDVIGKRITFDMDVAAFLGAGPDQPTFTQAGITIGGERTLIDNEDEIAVQNDDPPTTYFAATFQENLFMNLGAHAGVADSGSPIGDDTGCIGCNLTHTADFGLMNVQIDIDDPADGNPWDGSGSTVIEVFVNGDILRNPNNGEPYFFEKTDGGYTDNFITLFGMRQTFTLLDNLATHTFDNLTVWSAPLFPVDVDLDDDGDVDGTDFLLIQRTDPSLIPDWEAAYPGNSVALSTVRSVPEPSTALLLCFATGWRTLFRQ